MVSTDYHSGESANCNCNAYQVTREPGNQPDKRSSTVRPGDRQHIKTTASFALPEYGDAVALPNLMTSCQEPLNPSRAMWEI